jgi:metal-dependent amidase/aminoacylase/carboxypeptidase family protein
MVNEVKPKRDYTIEFCDSFPSTVSDNGVNSRLAEILKDNKAAYKYLSKPMPWSEDFGAYLNEYKGAFIGIGSGRKQPDIHSEDYNFPTPLVSKGIKIFKTIIDNY